VRPLIEGEAEEVVHKCPETFRLESTEDLMLKNKCAFHHILTMDLYYFVPCTAKFFLDLK